jgi:uncharacterized protein (TIGR02001 family)
MNKLHSAVPAVVLLAFTVTAQAQEVGDGESPHAISANVGVYSQYVFRGLTQTNEDPALQGGFDYSHASGFYVGTWGSNISWFADLNPGNSVSLEWDAYAGFRKSWDQVDGLTTDIGYLRYEYPGSCPALAPGILKPNTDEVYLGLGWKWAALRYSYAVSDLFGVAKSDGSSYLDLTVTIPLPRSISLALHAGHQSFEGAGNDALFGYEDYRATMSYAFGAGWTASVMYSQSTGKDAGYTVLGRNIGDDQVAISISRTFAR